MKKSQVQTLSDIGRPLKTSEEFEWGSFCDVTKSKETLVTEVGDKFIIISALYSSNKWKNHSEVVKKEMSIFEKKKYARMVPGIASADKSSLICEYNKSV